MPTCHDIQTFGSLVPAAAVSRYVRAVRDTRDEEYADRLMTKETAAWKRVLNVQAPYRWNLRRHDLGRTLDIGCGIGRNLSSLPAGSLGVDHNETSIAMARARGASAAHTTPPTPPAAGSPSNR